MATGSPGRDMSRPFHDKRCHAGVLEPYVEHGRQAQRSFGGLIAYFDRRLPRNAGSNLMKKEARRKRRNASPPRQTSKPGAAARGEESSAQPAHERKAPGRRRWWFAVALLALGWAIYTPCLSGPFLYDDYDLKEVHSTVRTGRWQAIVNSGRPLPYLTYLANHRWGGFDPFGSTPQALFSTA